MRIKAKLYSVKSKMKKRNNEDNSKGIILLNLAGLLAAYFLKTKTKTKTVLLQGWHHNLF
jgi:hypothetical protein